MNIALLTAAGSGTRMHQDIPKQFIHVENKPIIIYTLEAFQNHPSIDAIIVVCLEGWADVLSAYAKQFNITKLRWIVNGGVTGQDSIHNGLLKLGEECNPEDIVLVHDGNRPLITEEMISNSIAACKKYGSSVAAIPCTEVVFKSDDGSCANDCIKREYLRRTQTPHVYSLEKLLWAHDEAAKRNITNTAASCSLMYELGEKVYFSAGAERNIKITTTEDIDLFKALLHIKKEDWLK